MKCTRPVILQSAEILSIGKPCTEQEIGLWSASLKWFKGEQKVTNKAETRQLGGNVSGPGVSADWVCVDPVQTVKNATGAIVDGVANTNYFGGKNAAKLGTK